MALGLEVAQHQVVFLITMYFEIMNYLQFLNYAAIITCCQGLAF